MIDSRMISAPAMLAAITPGFMEAAVSPSFSVAAGIAEINSTNMFEDSYCLKKKDWHYTYCYYQSVSLN